MTRSFRASGCSFALAIALAALPARAQIAKGATKFLGNCSGAGTSGTPPADYAKLWTQMTPESVGQWGSIEGIKGTLNWSRLDALNDYCLRNGILFQQSLMVIGGSSPAWMSAITEAEFEKWVSSFAAKYPNTKIITVVTEPKHSKPVWSNALGGAGATGYDWVIEAFRIVRKYMPKAVLILEDYYVLRYETDAFLNIASKVKAAGYLDGVGCEAHGLETITNEELKANLAKVASLGVPIYITQYDLGIANDSLHKEVFSRQFPLFWESPHVAGVTLWGYLYGQTWSDGSGWIRNGVDRPAMAWLREYVSNHLIQPMPVGGLRNDGTIQGPSTATSPRSTSDGRTPAHRAKVSKTIDAVYLPGQEGFRDALGRP